MGNTLGDQEFIAGIQDISFSLGHLTAVPAVVNIADIAGSLHLRVIAFKGFFMNSGKSFIFKFSLCFDQI